MFGSYRRIIALILMSVLALSLSACGQQGGTEATFRPTQEPTNPPTPVPTDVPATPEPEPTELPEVPKGGFGEDGKPVNIPVAEGKSPTTGLDFEGEYHPMLCIIENDKLARPQWGLGSADVVYESTIEVSVTRFLAIFNDNIPDQIGPIRSCRTNFVDTVVEWDAAVVRFGGAEDPTYNVTTKIRESNVRIDLNGMTDSKHFYRTSKRSAPHNAVVNGPNTYADVSTYEANTRSFIFSERALEQGVATSFAPSINYKSNRTSYVYNEESQKYMRFLDGEKHIDANDNTQIAVTNIIIMETNFSAHPDRIHTLVPVIGEGKTQYYTGGRFFTGTWIRRSQDERTVYLDEQGNEIILLPGNTWIQIVPSMDTVISK